MKLHTLLLSAALAIACAPHAHAAECGPLKLVNTVPLTLKGHRVLLPVKINDVEQTFLLDTGGAATQISAPAAEVLKLPVIESGGKMLDLYGHASTQAVRVESFTLGRLRDRATYMPIWPDPTLGVREGFSGLLAADYMGRYDIEFDFAGGKMNYFMEDHCDGKVVYWPAAAVAVVPMVFRQDHHLRIPVVLNGHTFNAIIDTGAPVSTIMADEAKRVFGLAGPAPGDPTGTGDGPVAFEHAFDTLSFEGVTIGNPRMTVIPNLVGKKDANNGFVTGSRTKRVDDLDVTEPPILIGMNILSRLHLYVAFGEGKIYVTPAMPPPVAAPK